MYYGHQSYVYFEVIFTFLAQAGPVYLDGSANCFFSRILVTGNGGVLQDFNTVWAKSLFNDFKK